MCGRVRAFFFCYLSPRIQHDPYGMSFAANGFSAPKDLHYFLNTRVSLLDRDSAHVGSASQWLELLRLNEPDRVALATVRGVPLLPPGMRRRARRLRCYVFVITTQRVANAPNPKWIGASRTRRVRHAQNPLWTSHVAYATRTRINGLELTIHFPFCSINSVILARFGNMF